MKLQVAVNCVLLCYAVCCCTGYATLSLDNLQKCHINDNECMRSLYQSIVSDIGKTGIPELNIPPVDPIALSNVTVNVQDILEVTLVEGIAKGVKDCIFQKFRINITSESGYQENKCNITIKGHYKASAKSPILQNLLGGSSVEGDGNVKINIEKLHLQFAFPFYAQKRDDGEIYIKCNYDDIKYNYKIGKMTLYADNLFVGKQDSSKAITTLLNENWRFVLTNFGQPFIDTAMKIYFKFAGNFFEAVPVRHFIIDDLSQYAKP